MRRTQLGLSEIFWTKVRVTAYGAMLFSTALFCTPAFCADFDAEAEVAADASLKQLSESTPASDESVRDALRSVFKETAPERVKEKSKTEAAAVKPVADEKATPAKQPALKESVAKTSESKTPAKQSASSAKSKAAFSGVADYYADMFHGRKTASGQLHDKHKMTAAHLSLPFGTKVKVVSRHTGKSCVVTVNDRGPYTKNKIIDLSFAAAKELGLVTAGSRLVDCYLIEPE